MDVAEIDGTKLIQLKNPWGRHEWKGAWADGSKEWTSKRKNMIYQHMKAKGTLQTNVGEEDGIFWMSLTDFFLHFEDLYVCRFFDDSWEQISYEDSWSVARGTAGGCRNYDTHSKNPMACVSV